MTMATHLRAISQVCTPADPWTLLMSTLCSQVHADPMVRLSQLPPLVPQAPRHVFRLSLSCTGQISYYTLSRRYSPWQATSPAHFT